VLTPGIVSITAWTRFERYLPGVCSATRPTSRKTPSSESSVTNSIARAGGSSAKEIGDAGGHRRDRTANEVEDDHHHQQRRNQRNRDYDPVDEPASELRAGEAMFPDSRSNAEIVGLAGGRSRLRGRSVSLASAEARGRLAIQRPNTVTRWPLFLTERGWSDTSCLEIHHPNRLPARLPDGNHTSNGTVPSRTFSPTIEPRVFPPIRRRFSPLSVPGSGLTGALGTGCSSTAPTRVDSSPRSS